jgi:hypothetical protein
MGELIIWEFSHIHDHHMDGKLQARDSLGMAHLELAHCFLLLHLIDVLKIHMRAHSILFFKTYLSLDFLLSTLKPTYGSSISMNKTYKYNSKQTLIHMDCH